jgi:hypothetical protein
MAKMRSDIILLGILLANVKKIKSGLCLLCLDLYADDDAITITEHNHLRTYISKHRPDNRRTREGQAYYWMPGAIPVRTKWLKAEIKNLKSVELSKQ